MEAIFLPGIGASDRDFPEYQKMFPSLKIIRYDGCISLQDHVDRIDETVMELEKKKKDYIVIGHSMGANLAHYYITHRDLKHIQGYTMIGGGPRFYPLKTWKTIFSLPNWGIALVLFFIALGAPFLFFVYGWHGMYQRVNVIDLFKREGINSVKEVYVNTLQPLQNDPKPLRKEIPAQIIILPKDILFPKEGLSETEELIENLEVTPIQRDIIHFTHHLDILVVAHISQWLDKYEISEQKSLPFDMEYALSHPKSISVDIEGFSIPRLPVIVLLLVLISNGIVTTFPQWSMNKIMVEYWIKITNFLQIQGLNIWIIVGILLATGGCLFGYSWLLSPEFPKESQYKLRELPFITIIVPMRNEERNIGNCLKSLLNLNYPNYEILVSDGNSEDNSIEVANSVIKKNNTMNLRAEVLLEDPLPKNWVGKSWGCWNAVKQASGEILLFTDADTYHHPLGLRETVRVLQDDNLSGLSVIGKFDTKSFWEKSILPFFKSLLFIIFGGRFANRSGRTLAIGQYIMVKSDVYQQFGGHQSIKSEIAEDIHLAQKIAENGSFEVYNGNDIYQVRMYQSYTEIQEGLTRNAVESIGGKFSMALIAILGLFCWRFGPLLLYFILLGEYSAIVNLFLLGMLIFTVGIYWIDVKTNENPWWYAFLVPLGIINITYFLLKASLASKSGIKRSWKGRVYDF